MVILRLRSVTMRSTIHQSTYFYKVAPGLAEGHLLRHDLPTSLPYSRDIQIVGRVAHNLDYVLMAYSKVENSALLF